MTVAKRVMGPALVVLVIVGILFVAVLPTRTLLQQRRDTKAATARSAMVVSSVSPDRWLITVV